MGILILSIFLDPSPENLTLGISIPLSGVYTWLLYLTRDHWIKKLHRNPVRNAILVGSLNAAVIEALFLAAEKTFGAAGVAAHPNLVIDLLITMPWYIGMVWFFVRVQRKERFPLGSVLILGAVYELGADGILGGVLLPTLMGIPPNLWEFMILMPLGMFWQFIPVYSSMVLAPAWILEYSESNEAPQRKRWARGFLPLLVLLPFAVYLILFLSLLAETGV